MITFCALLSIVQHCMAILSFLTTIVGRRQGHLAFIFLRQASQMFRQQGIMTWAKLPGCICTRWLTTEHVAPLTNKQSRLTWMRARALHT